MWGKWVFADLFAPEILFIHYGYVTVVCVSNNVNCLCTCVCLVVSVAQVPWPCEAQVPALRGASAWSVGLGVGAFVVACREVA